MKDFIFISDFDGTLTDRDFYYIVIDKYMGDKGIELLKKWRNNEIKDVDFLGTVFQSINKEENEIMDDILSINLDPNAPEFIKKVKNSGGDFVILSAGTSYYIEKLLSHHGINDVKIISNGGIYENRGIKMIPDKNSPYYSERYGIAKELVVEKYKKEYKNVYFAGDSGPDLKAAMIADKVYAKGILIDLLNEHKIPFKPFNNYKDIENDLFKNK